MSSEDRYRLQHRGDRGAYARYLDGMDQTMRQKVALTAAHLLCTGRVADMGMGSGTGSYAIAALYPALDVVGVDVNPTMVKLAAERYVLPNLSFVAGNVAERVFEPGTLDGILDSSVLHHVTSFQGYDHEAARRALEVQVEQLRVHGVLVVRDFVDPGPEEVLLDVRDDDGDDGEDPRTCSTARLLERFSREFRSLHPAPGFLLITSPAEESPVGFRRYRLPRKLAAEFVLRKDYRTDWESEAQEEYTYFTQEQFEQVFASLGMRLLASTPLRNPWIVENRFEGKIALRSCDGVPEEFPPTNYLIAAERVPAGEGVRFVEGPEQAPLGFLTMDHYRNRKTGRVMDLVRRPHPTVDILPWFVADDDVLVLARMGYPRPILQGNGRGSTPIDGARAVGYVTEPLSMMQEGDPFGTTVEAALEARAGVKADRIRAFRKGSVYYPSPGGLQEEVRSALVEIEPVYLAGELAPVSGYSTSGRVRAIEARQLLRAAQVGGLPDARLELNVYDLLTQIGIPPGPWIGETPVLGDAERSAEITSLDRLGSRPGRRLFERASGPGPEPFLDLCCARFDELDACGTAIGSAALEFVVPRNLSVNTISVAVLRRVGDEVLLGIDDDDLPAAQCFSGNSELLVAPAWRLPKGLRTMTPARAWVRARLAAEYGVACGGSWLLGGSYRPSPGCTPEVVHPMAIEVRGEAPAERSLLWIPLVDAVRSKGELLDGHLRIVAFRAAHALGVLG